MQVSVESVGNLERRVILSLPAGDVEAQVGSRLREIAHTVRIKGFRPGKVPTKVVEQRYGGQVRAEILDGLLREGLGKAVRENELHVVGAPQIDAGRGCRRGRAEVRGRRWSWCRTSASSTWASWKSSATPRRSPMPTSSACSRTCASSAPAGPRSTRAAKAGDLVNLET